jgi:transposase
MEAETLGQLPVAELVTLVVQQQATIERLQARIAELETVLGKPRKTPENSSVPPAAARKPNRPVEAGGERKRGPVLGHVGATRRTMEPTERLEVRVARCDRCGADLAALAQQPTERRQLVDLPPVQPQVQEAVVHRVVCPDCGQTHTAAFPAGFPAPVAFGPRVQAAASYLHEVHHLPYGRLRQVVGELFALDVAVGSLVNLVRRTGQALEPAAAAVLAEVRTSAVVGSDETGQRIAGRNAWQWVVQTPEASAYVIAPSRGAGVLRDLLGDHHPAVWVSDCWSAQLQAPAERFQLCLAHQLRDLQYAQDCGDRQFAPAMAAVLGDALALGKERHAIAPTVFARRHAEIEAACDQLLVEDTAHREGQRLQRRYRTHRDKLFVFLERADVPADNNASERALRNSVIHRKVTGGFRSDWAPVAYTTLLSVVETAKKQGQAVFATLLGAILSPLATAPTPPAPT